MSENINTIQIEEHILGSIINVPETYNIVSKMITDKHFTSEKTQRLWKIIKKQSSNGGIKDFPSFCANLTGDDGLFDNDAYYVSTLVTSDLIPDTYNELTKNTITEWSNTLHEKYIMRFTGKELKNLLLDIDNNDKKAFENLIRTHTKLSGLIDMKPQKDFDIKDVTKNTDERIQESEINIVKTGYEQVDRLSGGFTRKEISIIGGRPGHGKTTFMLNLIKNLVSRENRVLVFNREMSNVEMMKKLIVLEGENISYGLVRKGITSQEDYNNILKSKEKIDKKYNKDKFIMYDNIPDFNSALIEAKKFKPDIIFDDYIQLISGFDDLDGRRFQLEKIVHGYKWLAKELNCVVICVSQLNRAMETRGNPIPMLSDLAESGAIEQVAENVMFVFNENKINADAKKHILKIISAKVRYGNTGTSNLGYEGDKVRIYQNEEEWYNMNKNKENTVEG